MKPGDSLLLSHLTKEWNDLAQCICTHDRFIRLENCFSPFVSLFSSEMFFTHNATTKKTENSLEIV